MTSVLNRQPLLSGNKRITLTGLILSLLISSCNIFSHGTTSQSKDTIQTKVDSAKITTVDKPVDTGNMQGTKTDTISGSTTLKSWAKKEVYNIAFILPFTTDEAELNKLEGESTITGYQPLASLEFYEGALMALDTLKAAGVNLNVTVYNHLKDSASTALLMQSAEIKKMDLIIGPVFNDGVKIAAEAANKNQCYLVSPLSPFGLQNGNTPFFFMANAPITSQLNKLIDYTIGRHPAANFIVVYRADKPNELRIANDFKSEYAKLYKTGTINEAYSISGISAVLNEEENFVFIASNDELYVNGLVRDLSKIGRDKSVTLLGLQNILNLESISLDYFENLHLHYPACYWVDQHAEEVKNFNTTFVDKYAIRPSEFAYRGYDITIYFGGMLKYFGPDLGKDIAEPNLMFLKMLYPLSFKSVMSDDYQVKYYENSNISIIEYDKFQFVKAH